MTFNYVREWFQRKAYSRCIQHVKILIEKSFVKIINTFQDNQKCFENETRANGSISFVKKIELNYLYFYNNFKYCHIRQ